MNIMKTKILYAIVVIVIIAIAIVGYYYFSYSGQMICWNPDEPCGGRGFTPSCTDSDRGIVPNTLGAVSGIDKNGFGYSYTDSCIDNVTLTEYYCSSKTPLSKVMNCVTPPTNKCENGACICKCSDGTSCNSCSSTKPKYCSNGNLIDNYCYGPDRIVGTADDCKCPSSASVCNADGTCSQSFDFAMSINPGSGSVANGNTITTNVTSTLISGTSQNVQLTVSDCPRYSTCVINPISGYPTFISTLAITANSTPGNYRISINGTSGSLIKGTAYQLTITQAPQTCSDGTLYGQCSSTKPKYCSNGNLVNNCSYCGCPTGQDCNVTSQTCYTPPTFTFSVSLNPTTDTTTQGNSFSRTVQITVTNTNLGSTPQPVSLSTTGSIPGITISSPSPLSCTPSTTSPYQCTSSFTVSGTPTSPGTYSITVTGTSGTSTSQAVYTLTINPIPFDFSMSVSPASGSVANGNKITTALITTLLSGTSQNVQLILHDCPSGSACVLTPISGYPTFGSSLNITANSTPGTYKISINGTSGSLIKGTAFYLTIS